MDEYNVDTYGSFKFHFKVTAKDASAAIEQAQSFLSSIEDQTNAALSFEVIDWDVY
jgi:hypothetical protein